MLLKGAKVELMEIEGVVATVAASNPLLENTVDLERKEGDFEALLIGCHNINGIKTNKSKLDNLLEWKKLEKIDILGIVESNISEKEGKYILMENGDNKSYWASADIDKKKGSGAGIIVSNKWEKHLGKIDRFSEYMLVARFFFKQLELVVIIVYFPPNNKTIEKQLQQEIVKTVMNGNSSSSYIVMGDFNQVVDVALDHSNSNRKKHKFPIFKWLRKAGFVDTFREVNPEMREYSWTNNVTETRIDYIWASEGLSSGLVDARIQEVEIFTGSDHKVVTAKILLNRLIGKKSIAKIKRNGSFRYKFLFEEMQEEDWEVFREALWTSLKKKSKIMKFLDTEVKDCKEGLLDETWDIVERGLLEAARIAIPRKKVWNNVSHRKEKVGKSTRLAKDTSALRKIIWALKAAIKSNTKLESIEIANETIRKVGKDLDINIQLIDESQYQESLTSLQGWYKILNKSRKQELEELKRCNIEDCISKRFEMI